MNNVMNRELNMMVAVEDFLEANPLDPAVPKVTTLKTVLSASIASMLSQGAGQVSGRSELRAGVGDRRSLQKQLRTMLGELVKTAHALDPIAHPEAAEVRYPKAKSYQATRDAAQAISAVVTANKAAFVEFDWPTTVDTDLTALIAQFDAAFTRRNNGLSTQISGTEGLAATAKHGVATVRALDAVLSRRLKSNPGLRAAWKSATHIQRAPKTKDTTVTTAAAKVPAAAPAVEPVVPVPTDAASSGTTGEPAPSGEVAAAPAPATTA